MEAKLLDTGEIFAKRSRVELAVGEELGYRDPEPHSRIVADTVVDAVRAGLKCMDKQLVKGNEETNVCAPTYNHQRSGDPVRIAESVL
jgi:hypothetical protein